MRWTLLITGLILFALATSALAGSVGLGFMIGEPTGLSLKAWSGSRTAFDVAAGWSLGSSDWVYVHSDYLWHRYDLDVDMRGSLPYYFGLGGRVLLREGHDSKLGVRLPLGLDYITHDQRFDFFIEVAPIINLVPDTELDISGGIGARIYF
jgi:hypothetical protein